ncbi:MAG: anti-sigma F factor [Oscillospiraceae bacterium]|nr:anti-sigma F factor [Oscillospiraceae bacterium]
MIGNCFCMTLPSYASNERVVVEAVSAFAKLLDPAQDELGDIRTSVSEAFRNCIEYAYPNKAGEVSVRCQVLKNNVLSVVIRDKGKGIENVQQASKPMFSTGGSGHSGMGITIMETFMDDFKIASTPNGGTTVRMKKRIKG